MVQDGMTRIAYQGLEGSFSEAAARSWAELEGHSPVRLIAARSARGVVKAVQSGEADYGVVGVVNSTSGLIGETVDTMAAVRHELLATLTMPVVVCLFAREGDALEDIKAVYSHPASLYQCEHRLRKLLPGVALQAAPTSALAATKLSLGELPAGSGVLCSPRAGRLRNLKMLVCPTNDSPHNETSFMVFERPAGRH